jgi:hypothetical protein
MGLCLHAVVAELQVCDGSGDMEVLRSLVEVVLYLEPAGVRFGMTTRGGLECSLHPLTWSFYLLRAVLPARSRLQS